MPVCVCIQYVCVPQEAAEWRTAHCNGWNGVNGMASNTWKPCVWSVEYRSIYSNPAITMRLSSPIKVPPAACGVFAYGNLMDFCCYVSMKLPYIVTPPRRHTPGKIQIAHRRFEDILLLSFAESQCATMGEPTILSINLTHSQTLMVLCIYVDEELTKHTIGTFMFRLVWLLMF